MPDAYFSFDKETKRLVKQLGYIPKGCYCTTQPGVFIPEHAEKNRGIVKEELAKKTTKGGLTSPPCRSIIPT